MIERLQNINYNKNLISMLLKAKAGAITVTIVGPIFYLYIFNGSIPFNILISFMLVQFIIFIFRLKLSQKLLNNIKTLDTNTANKMLKKYLYFIFANSFLWGISTIFALTYGTQEQVYIFMSMIFIVIAGSLATLTPIFHAVFFFIFNILSFFIFSLIFIGANDTYYLIALILIMFSFVTLPAAYRIHTSMSDSISKSEEIQSLNYMLEVRVKEAILDTKKKEKLLQQQTRLAQMGEMMSMIAHQWRQPLGAISGAVIGIQTKQASGKFKLEIEEDRDDFMHFINKKHESINEYVQVLSNTIDDFRNFFKPDKEKELIALTTPIKRALQIVENSMNAKNIQLEVIFENDNKILMYQNEMMQVILNILKNSEDNFIEKETLDATISITCKKQNLYYIISICDNGGGISEDILAKVFDPYFSTKEERNGTGLGLYMSKIIVEEHNDGKLSVQNSANGVCFIIQFGLKNE